MRREGSGKAAPRSRVWHPGAGNMDSASAAQRLKKFEGSTDYMYRCTGGEVTVGVGHAIPDAAHASLLAWIDAPVPDPVETEFARVAAAEIGLPAVRYQGLSQRRMNQQAVDA